MATGEGLKLDTRPLLYASELVSNGGVKAMLLARGLIIKQQLREREIIGRWFEWKRNWRSLFDFGRAAFYTYIYALEHMLRRHLRERIQSSVNHAYLHFKGQSEIRSSQKNGPIVVT